MSPLRCRPSFLIKSCSLPFQLTCVGRAEVTGLPAASKAVRTTLGGALRTRTSLELRLTGSLASRTTHSASKIASK